MGRAPCCDKANVKKGPWSPEEDAKLKDFIEKFGTGGNWIALPQKAGLKRCGKSCRLRWLNYLRPNIRHGEFSDEEDRIICTLFASIGSRWSIIAGQLPGRTDNDIKNYWNTKLKKKLLALTNNINNNTNNNLIISSATTNHLPPPPHYSQQIYSDYQNNSFQFQTPSIDFAPSVDNFSFSTPQYPDPYFHLMNNPSMLVFGSNNNEPTSSSDGSCSHSLIKQEDSITVRNDFQGLVSSTIFDYNRYDQKPANVLEEVQQLIIDEKEKGLYYYYS